MKVKATLRTALVLVRQQMFEKIKVTFQQSCWESEEMSPPSQLAGSSLLSFLNIANMEAATIQSQEQIDPTSQVNPDAFEPQETCSFSPSRYSSRG